MENSHQQDLEKTVSRFTPEECAEINHMTSYEEICAKVREIAARHGKYVSDPQVKPT